MNCETFTRVDTSSLYKNGRLIEQTSVTFLVRQCQNIDLDILTQVYCLCKRRMLRIFYVVSNSGDSTINNTYLKVNILPACSCIKCPNDICKYFKIDNLETNNSNTYYIDIPFPCNRHYLIKGKIIQNNILLKEECIAI